MLKILSIDWDYFFPNDEDYDWGHREAPFFIDTIWNFRTNAKAPDGKLMLDVHVPTIPKNFWKKVLRNTPILTIAESHCSIWPMLDNMRMFGPIEVTNLDAHHDCGYKEYPRRIPKTVAIGCGDWGYWGLKTKRISSLRQFYPAWRGERPEGRAAAGNRGGRFGLPEPTSYNAVFLCRSGAWTPPWYDDRLQQFIEDSRLRVDGTLEPRELTLEAARRQQQDANMMNTLEAVNSFEEVAQQKG